jgi:cell division protein FtsZ
MQEIEEGNRVIYEAAGEEANVIFGLVNKDEMNEYVSYTVIATGFSAKSEFSGVSKLKSEKKEKPKEDKEEIRFGGFDKSKFELSDTDDLDVPTIFRVKGTKNKVYESSEQIDAFESEKEEEKKKKKEKEAELREQDSSSFLRMMMD